jgi:hypothetical protein
MTSLVFMLLEVPDPVWKTSIGKCWSQSPRATSAAAVVIASAVSCGSTPREALTAAAAPLMAASAPISSRSMGVPEMGKFSTARWVCARHFAQAGTRTSPMESCSMRCSVVSCPAPSCWGAVLSAGMLQLPVWCEVTVLRQGP